MPTAKPPAVGVIIPAYHSEATIEGCLTAIRAQVGVQAEVVVIDSSPDDASERIVRNQFPEVKLVRSHQRLLPHAARNLGVGHTLADLLAFTDPDIYPSADWLTMLVDAHVRFGGAVVGAMLAANRDWQGRGMHLGKFDLFVPGGPPRPTSLIMTGSLMLSRSDFLATEGFVGSEMLGDVLLSWRLEDLGIRMTFVPSAIVYHDHVSTVRSFIVERYVRGLDFARLRSDRRGWGRLRTGTQLLLTLFPLRLLNLLWRGGINAGRAGLFIEFLATFMWVLVGQGAWLAGESVGYARRVLQGA